MISESKKKRKIQKLYAFASSCLVSLLGLFFYLVGKKKIPFPHPLLSKEKLFLFGVSIYSLVN
jgi:hypothetical protein